jgi:hypothetical protein
MIWILLAVVGDCNENKLISVILSSQSNIIVIPLQPNGVRRFGGDRTMGHKASQLSSESPNQEPGRFRGDRSRRHRELARSPANSSTRSRRGSMEINAGDTES